MVGPGFWALEFCRAVSEAHGMEYDFIVIGAGAAGLAAASRLAPRGKTLVLEARERAGGRIFTHHLPECAQPLELGAEFIHGIPEETFDVVRADCLPVYDVASEHFKFERGKWGEFDFDDKVTPIFSKLKNRGKKDRSFAEFIDAFPKLRADVKKMAISFVEGYQGAEIEKVSESSLAGMSSEDSVDTSFRFRDGYSQFVGALVRRTGGAELRYGETVTEVRWGKGRAEVTTASGDHYVARQLVLTLPIGVLKAGRMKFTPALPKKTLEAMSQIESGEVYRISLWFSESFWEKREWNLGFLHSTEADFPTWWTAHPMRYPVVTAWAGGGQARRMKLTDEADAVARALNTFAKLNRRSSKALQAELRGFAFHDWNLDPNSLGSYSYIGVGGMSAPAALARPIDATLYFAGEATAGAGRSGTVDGALASGYRAANLILKSR